MGTEILTTFTDRYNLIVGTVVAVLTYIFGKNWWLFALFLVFNLIDWITGWIKSRLAGAENSTKGLNGVIKKFGYWLMIFVSFLMSTAFIGIGNVIGVNLQVTTLLGWFVLASLMVNELRSILENFVEAGYHPPEILTKGLAVASEIIDKEKEGDDE